MDEDTVIDNLDAKVLNDFQHVFRGITGLNTVLGVLGQTGSLHSCTACNSKNAFCRAIHASLPGLETCHVDEKEVTDRLIENPSPLVFTCYAGLTGIALPILVQGEFVGAIFAGSALPHKHSPAQFQALRDKLTGYRVCMDDLEKAYYDLPVVSEDTIQTAIELLSLMVTHVTDREENLRLHRFVCEKQVDPGSNYRRVMELEQQLRRSRDEIRRLRKQLAAASHVNRTVLTESDRIRHRRVMQEACMFIDMHYSEHIGLSDVAEYVGLSPNYLSCVFRKECGCTFTEYLMQKRISKACELLQDLNANVSEVSLRVGYDNVTYFSTLFKRLMGVSPGKFRNRIS